MRLPPNDPRRYTLANEVHARPYEALRAPERASFLAMLGDAATRQRAHPHLCALAARFNVAPPAPDADHYSADLGPLRVKWERHSEFTRYKFIVHGPCEDPFAQPALALVPHDWLEALPGEVLVAAHAALLPGDRGGERLEEIAARWFTGNTLIGARIAGGAASAFTDFRVHADGFSRLLILDESLGTRQAGRMLQRLLEIDTYRMTALLALPVARELAPSLAQWDSQVVELTAAMAEACEADEPHLLDRLTRLAGAVERSVSATQFRFGATEAYFELVERRIAELREVRIEGVQTFQEFMERRLVPAVATCRSAAQRQAQLSERVARAGQLLSTRVDITRERQNQELLASMNRRAKLQLRLQETVEGLSVAAITYYAAGLVGYMAKGLKAAGLHLDADLVVGASIPLIALLVALGLRRMRRRLMRETQPASPAPH